MSISGIVFGGALFLAGFALMWRAIRCYRIGRTVLDTPTERVRSASVGRTELEGRAEPAEYVVYRPFSEGQWLCADDRIKQRAEDTDSNWRACATIFEHTVTVPFYSTCSPPVRGSGADTDWPRPEQVGRRNTEHVGRVSVAPGPERGDAQWLNRASVVHSDAPALSSDW